LLEPLDESGAAVTVNCIGSSGSPPRRETP
jgi:hypothetical protein